MSRLKALAGAAAAGEDDGLSPMDRRVQRRVVTPRAVGAAVAALALVGTAVIGYLRVEPGRSLTVDAGRITVSAVGYGPFREYIPVTGNVVPKETVFLSAVEGGQVIGLHVEAGDRVDAGQPLLELKNTNLQLEFISVEARLTEQINNLNTTRLQFEQNRLRHRRELIEIDQRIDELSRRLRRGRPLVEPGGVSLSEIEDIESELRHLRLLREAVAEAQQVDARMQTRQMAQLDAAVTRIDSNLEIARENLDNLTVTAPIAGLLTVFDANLGESKMPGERIGQIDDLSGFKVSAFIDEFYLARVVIGQRAELDAGRERHVLEITRVLPNVVNRQFQVELEFVDATPAGIRRGQTLRMNLQIGAQTDSLVLASGPYVDDTGGQWVFVVAPDRSTAQRRAISAGRRSPDLLEITGGLQEGELVITSGYAGFLNIDRLDLRRD